MGEGLKRAFAAARKTRRVSGQKTRPRAISSAVRRAIRREREACAKIADSFRCGCCGMDGKAAAAIRARTPKEQTPDSELSRGSEG